MGVAFSPRVFLDSNVLYPRTCRDWFGVLYTESDEPPFYVYWTEDVLAELLYHLRKAHPNWDGERLSGIRRQLAGTFEAGYVDSFEIRADYGGSDPHDAHVYYAAVECGADYLITFNTKDFEWGESAAPFEVIHPDDFLCAVDDWHPWLVESATGVMTSYWLSRAGEADLPRRLRKSECPQFAARVTRHLQRHM